MKKLDFDLWELPEGYFYSIGGSHWLFHKLKEVCQQVDSISERLEELQQFSKSHAEILLATMKWRDDICEGLEKWKDSIEKKIALNCLNQGFEEDERKFPHLLCPYCGSTNVKDNYELIKQICIGCSHIWEKEKISSCANVVTEKSCDNNVTRTKGLNFWEAWEAYKNGRNLRLSTNHAVTMYYLMEEIKRVHPDAITSTDWEVVE